jgi:hypothetical protein
MTDKEKTWEPGKRRLDRGLRGRRLRWEDIRRVADGSGVLSEPSTFIAKADLCGERREATIPDA